VVDTGFWWEDVSEGDHLKDPGVVIYNKSTRCNSGSIVFIENYKYVLHVSDALCVHLQEHYKL